MRKNDRSFFGGFPGTVSTSRSNGGRLRYARRPASSSRCTSHGKHELRFHPDPLEECVFGSSNYFHMRNTDWSFFGGFPGTIYFWAHLDHQTPSAHGHVLILPMNRTFYFYSFSAWASLRSAYELYPASRRSETGAKHHRKNETGSKRCVFSSSKASEKSLFASISCQEQS